MFKSYKITRFGSSLLTRLFFTLNLILASLINHFPLFSLKVSKASEIPLLLLSSVPNKSTTAKPPSKPLK